MEPGFWHQRWQDNEIDFHRERVHPALERFWSDPEGAGDAVLVPLCGKNIDMRWLAERGHFVSGVELERTAVDAFFAEWSVEAHERVRRDGLPERSGGGVNLAIGDFFDYRPPAPLERFYDRGALVALPKSMRTRYLAQLARCIATTGEGLLITFEYDPDEMAGPPFPVDEDEVRDQPWFAVERLARGDVTADYPGLAERGVCTLYEAVYHLTRTERNAPAASGRDSPSV